MREALDSGYFGGVVSLVGGGALLDGGVSEGGVAPDGGGRAEPLVLDGAGFDGFAAGAGLVSLALGLGVGAAVPDVVADALAPELAAEVLEATADWPDHQSFLARCDGEAFR